MEQSSPAPSFKRRAKFLVGGSVVLIAIVGLILWATNVPGATAYYVTPSELSARGPSKPGAPYRLNGKVVPGSIERNGLDTSFEVTDGKTEIPVMTDRALPDAFTSRAEVIATGAFDGETFTADQVWAKCPSKFKARSEA